MSDSSEIPADASISDKTDRLEEIIAQLEGGELSLERAKELHTEGTRLLAKLEEELDIGDGEIIDRSAEDSLEK